MKVSSFSARSFMDALQKSANLSERKGIYIQHVFHDDWCPTLKTNRGLDCTCKPDIRLVRIDSAEELAAEMKVGQGS